MGLYALSTCILLFLDFAWVYFKMGPMYIEMIPKIQNTEMSVRIPYAVLSYTLMVVGLCVFVLPNVYNESISMLDPEKLKNIFFRSMFYGGIFGVVVYGIYDFTAAAVLSKWDVVVALKDIAWGFAVYVLAAFIPSVLYYVSQKNNAPLSSRL